jgi:glycosyltransferase involved in cell wall biosynthesis
MSKKLKVIWFCYFTNHDVQTILKPYKQVGEYAPWIGSLIPLFENDDTIELHVVSQHKWIGGYKRFTNKGITYHFINKGIPFIGRHWPGVFRVDLWTNYFLMKKYFTHIVKIVKPDIIHMHGTENEFCTGITQFHEQYPVFITIQGFIHKTVLRSAVIQKRIDAELKILRMFNHFGYRTETMGKDIKSHNPDATLHWHKYPIKVIEPIDIPKKYDIVFFARMSKEKGIEDLLKAIAIIKDQKPDISLCAIGEGKTKHLKSLARTLGIEENIMWAGFLPTQNNVHELASAARVSVLPTYHDMIPGTIVESMFLKLPVIAYNVGSIHEVNKNYEIICLVKKGDIYSLANEIICLLNDATKLKEKAELSRQRALEMFVSSNNEVREDLLKAYISTIDDFHSRS